MVVIIPLKSRSHAVESSATTSKVYMCVFSQQPQRSSQPKASLNTQSRE